MLLDVSTSRSGPMFDGRARAAANAYVNRLERQLADEGLNILKHANVGNQAQDPESAEVTPLRNPEHFQYDFDLAELTERCDAVWICTPAPLVSFSISSGGGACPFS